MHAAKGDCWAVLQEMLQHPGWIVWEESAKLVSELRTIDIVRFACIASNVSAVGVFLLVFPFLHLA